MSTEPSAPSTPTPILPCAAPWRAEGRAGKARQLGFEPLALAKAMAASGSGGRVLGMSHHLLRAGRIVREWTVFDEFALMKRLFAPD
jgi:hypothetical protein